MIRLFISLVLMIFSVSVHAEEKTGWQWGIGWGVSDHASLMSLEIDTPKIFGFGKEFQRQIRLYVNGGDTRIRGATTTGATSLHNRLSAGLRISDAEGLVLPFLCVGYEKIFSAGDLITSDSGGLILSFGADLVVTGRPNEYAAMFMQMDYRAGHPYNNVSGIEYFNGVSINLGIRFRH